MQALNTTRALLAVLLTAAMLTACGGDDDKPGDTPKPPETPKPELRCAP